MPASFQHNPDLTVPASPAANSVAAWSAANNLSATIAMNSASISTIADGDIILVYDASASGLATITRANLTTGLGASENDVIIMMEALMYG